MTPDSSTTNRIQIEGAGVGEIGKDAIDRRAREIAICDGRNSPNQTDLLAARHELCGGGPSAETAPESTPASSNLTSRHEVPGETGHQTEKHLPDDETTASECLVQEGLAEADRDRRSEAAEAEDIPPA